jgi:phage gpG-like protein
MIVAKLIFNKIPKLTEGMKREASKVVKSTALEIGRECRESMQEPKTGRIYYRGGGIEHQASAPGEAPAIDYGMLVNSIQTEMQSELTAVTFTNMEYAEVLELGGTRRAARPFMGPAAEKERRLFDQRMRRIFDGVV